MVKAVTVIRLRDTYQMTNAMLNSLTVFCVVFQVWIGIEGGQSGTVPCSDGFVLNPENNYCYKWIDSNMDWSDARLNCQGLGGDLAKVDTAEVHAFITLLLSDESGNKEYWIGANDISKEGVFRWSDFSLVTWDSFVNSQPNGGTSQNCVVHTKLHREKWHDRECEDSYLSICQRQPDYLTDDRPWVKIDSRLVSHRFIIRQSFARSVLDCAKFCKPEVSCDVLIFKYDNNTAVNNCFLTSFYADTLLFVDWSGYITYRRQIL